MAYVKRSDTFQSFRDIRERLKDTMKELDEEQDKIKLT